MKHLSFFLLCLAISCRKEDNFSTKDNQSQNQTNPTSTETPIEIGNLTPKEQFIRQMLNATLKGNEKLDVSDFNISETEKVQGQDYLYSTDFQHKNWYDSFKIQYPFLFHLDYIGEYQWQYKKEKPSEVKSFIIGYSMPIQQVENYYQKVEKSLEDYYNDLHEGMNEADIAYTLYNRLIKEVVYAQDRYPFHPVGALVHKKAVCEGYSSAYRMMLNLLGIETQMVISGVLPESSIAHVWNRVKIEGQWYNVDVTWDDVPKFPFTFGRYFLTSDNRFYGKEQHPRPLNYYQIPTASSTRFDNENTAFFRNNENQTEAVFHNGYWHFINKSSREIFKAKIGETPVKLHQISNKILKSELRIALGNSKIYFIDYDNAKRMYAIFSVDYEGRNIEKVKNITVDEVPSIALKSDSDQPTSVQGGGIALRKALALAKLKDAYYHGTEDYFEPKNSQRITLHQMIKEAEDLLKQPSVNTNQSKHLAEKLETLRKNYTMVFSVKK